MRWRSHRSGTYPYFEARNSTISTPSPIRISSAGTITERFSAGTAAVDGGSGADDVVTGAAVAGAGTSSATGDAGTSALVWEEGADAGGVVGAGSAGAGDGFTSEGSGEELGAAIAGAAGLLDFRVAGGLDRCDREELLRRVVAEATRRGEGGDCAGAPGDDPGQTSGR